jgi:hypothetical protein
MADDPRKRGEEVLRVSLHGTEILSLMARYPKLTRTEITDVVTRAGPMRVDVDRELTRLSSLKR